MTRISAYTRISLGLVILTIGIVFSADMIGLIPDRTKMAMAQRRAISESIAVICSRSASINDIETIRETFQMLVERNTDVLSIALRTADGAIPVVAGDHATYWENAPYEKSTLNHIRVPIYQAKKVWGYVELSFQPFAGNGWWRWLFNPITQLVVFVLLVGFAVYRYFLKRVLKQLDPTSVVPPRVRAALDTMAEGVVLLDNKANIVLTNQVFNKIIGKSQTEISGRKIDDLGWEIPQGNQHKREFPWIVTLHTKERQASVPLRIRNDDGQRRTFMVNSSPIVDNNGRSRGALATFDDVTQVEVKNEQLKMAIKKLEIYSNRIKQQNKKLQYLATRDPLTSCFNRRWLFQLFDKEFGSTKRYGHPLSCIMLDIDHFKSINDNHGHAMGDEVLKGVASAATSQLRKMDTIGRYGGEEFCIILPNTDMDNAVQAAERLRSTIEAQNFSGIKVTASFGVATTNFGAQDPSGLIDQADKALYQAKTDGRNRVVAWEKLDTNTTPIGPEKSVPSRKAETKEKKDNEKAMSKTSGRQPAEVKNLLSYALKGDQQQPATVGRQDEDTVEALKLVHANLAASARASELIRGPATAAEDNHSVVRLNKEAGWGDKASEAETTDLKRQSASYVAKMLQSGAS